MAASADLALTARIHLNGDKGSKGRGRGWKFGADRGWKYVTESCHISAVNARNEPSGRPHGIDRGPGIERAATLTDAVVAIAMTLLVLPLVETSGEVDTDHLRAYLNNHWDLLLSFVVSFAVIYVFWAAHGSAMRRLTDAHTNVAALGPLNMGWLLVIAFLPFPTSVVGRDLTTTSAPLYIGTMFVLAILTSAITMRVDRHLGTSGRTRWAWATTAIFGACTVISLANADLGMFALLAIAALRAVEAYVVRTTRSTDLTTADDAVIEFLPSEKPEKKGVSP